MYLCTVCIGKHDRMAEHICEFVLMDYLKYLYLLPFCTGCAIVAAADYSNLFQRLYIKIHYRPYCNIQKKMLLEARRQCQKCLLLLCLLASLRAEWNTKDFQKREHSLGMKHFCYTGLLYRLLWWWVFKKDPYQIYLQSSYVTVNIQ
jgi:hypothetical protein